MVPFTVVIYPLTTKILTCSITNVPVADPHEIQGPLCAQRPRNTKEAL
jgi:hypothetical protein